MEMVMRNKIPHVNLLLDLSERKSHFLKEIIKSIPPKGSVINRVKDNETLTEIK